MMRRTARFALIALAPVLFLGADAPQSCPMGPFDLKSPREQQQALYHAVSVTAELVAPSVDATTGRRRTVREPANPLAPQFPPAVNFIDTDLFAADTKDGIQPTAISSDGEFLRRVTLDLTGELPDTATTLAFLNDTASDKRTKKIDALLASDAFIDRWTMWFGDLVQNVQVAANSREYYQGRNAYYNWIKQSIKDGKPYDQMVREALAGRGDSFAIGTPNYVVRQLQPNGPIQDTYDNLAAHSGERFLGMQLLCLSCHNGVGHLELVNSYLQTKKRSDFWGMSAFFAQTRATRLQGDPNNPNIRKYDVEDNLPNGQYQLNTTSGNKSPRTPAAGQSSTVAPAYMFTAEGPRTGEGRRDAYGRILTADRQFARAAANYLWKEMFGMGIVEPTNAFDLNRLDPNKLPSNWTLQPTNPTLLEDLTTSFSSNGYSLKAILRTMAVSSSYQLSAKYTPGVWNEAWTPYFARHYPHRLQAEMLLDSITKATSVPITFTVNGIGSVTKSMALPDTTESARNANGRLLDEFGRGNRDDVFRTNDTAMAQALSLMNDTIITTRVHKATNGSTVAKVLASTSDPASIADQLYVATLGRHPDANESQVAVNYLKSGTLQNKTEDLQFVLLNSLEFLFK